MALRRFDAGSLTQSAGLVEDVFNPGDAKILSSRRVEMKLKDAARVIGRLRMRRYLYGPTGC